MSRSRRHIVDYPTEKIATRSEVFIPRLKYSVPAETVDIAILHAAQKLGYDRPTPEQAAAVREFLSRHRRLSPLEFQRVQSGCSFQTFRKVAMTLFDKSIGQLE